MLPERLLSLTDPFQAGINTIRFLSSPLIRTESQENDRARDWSPLQRLDASALCASALVAQDEAPCYCGDAADDCFEHADVIRELTKYVDDDDDEDDVEAIAPAPRQAPPVGWGKLLSA